VKVFLRPFSKVSCSITDILSMEDYAPFFFKGVGPWWLCICVLGFIFSIYTFWRITFLRLKWAPHLLQSCLHAAQDGFPPATKDMHLSFECLTITRTPSLQASLMDFHHDTSLKSILQDDSISSTSKANICSCLSKGVGLWSVVRPFICLFRIAHSIFTSVLHFCFGLIRPLAFNLHM